MRFLISVIDDSTESGTPEEMEAIDEFNDHLVADGHWILACGLGAPSTSMLIDNRGGANILTHGPLVDLPEFVSGFWLIEAPSHDIALDLATQGSQACNRKVELRPLLG